MLQYSIVPIDNFYTHVPFLSLVLASRSAFETPLRDPRCRAGRTAHLRRYSQASIPYVYRRCYRLILTTHCCLHAVRACLDETLRLFAPIPGNIRASIRPCVLPVSGVNGQDDNNPFYMPGPDIPLFICPLLIHRRKDLWGEDAEDFVPDRWMDPDRAKDLAADPFRFFPFSAGPRICPGQVCLP